MHTLLIVAVYSKWHIYNLHLLSTIHVPNLVLYFYFLSWKMPEAFVAMILNHVLKEHIQLNGLFSN